MYSICISGKGMSWYSTCSNRIESLTGFGQNDSWSFGWFHFPFETLFGDVRVLRDDVCPLCGGSSRRRTGWTGFSGHEREWQLTRSFVEHVLVAGVPFSVCLLSYLRRMLFGKRRAKEDTHRALICCWGCDYTRNFVCLNREKAGPDEYRAVRGCFKETLGPRLCMGGYKGPVFFLLEPCQMWKRCWDFEVAGNPKVGAGGGGSGGRIVLEFFATFQYYGSNKHGWIPVNHVKKSLFVGKSINGMTRENGNKRSWVNEPRWNSSQHFRVEITSQTRLDEIFPSHWVTCRLVNDTRALNKRMADHPETSRSSYPLL